MSLLVRVHEEHDGDIAIAALEGEIDASNTVEIGERLRALLSNRSTALVVDLTSATYLDSAGINLLFQLDAELRERQQNLRLVLPPTSPIARTIAITGLSAVVPTHGSRETAVEHR
jgi:anti-sigma B factor antagonist